MRTIRVEIAVPISAPGQRDSMVAINPKWLSTTGFLDKIDENLKKAMAA